MNVLTWDKVEEPDGTSAGGQFKPLSPKFLWSLQYRVHFGESMCEHSQSRGGVVRDNKLINKKHGGGGHKGPWSAQLQRGRLYHTPSPRLRNQYDRVGRKTVRVRGAEDRHKTASPGHSRTTALSNTAALAADIRPTQDQTHQHSAWSGEEL